jgi:hypothetical protein
MQVYVWKMWEEEAREQAEDRDGDAAVMHEAVSG